MKTASTDEIGVIVRRICTNYDQDFAPEIRERAETLVRMQAEFMVQSASLIRDALGVVVTEPDMEIDFTGHGLVSAAVGIAAGADPDMPETLAGIGRAGESWGPAPGQDVMAATASAPPALMAGAARHPAPAR